MDPEWLAAVNAAYNSAVNECLRLGSARPLRVIAAHLRSLEQPLVEPIAVAAAAGGICWTEELQPIDPQWALLPPITSFANHDLW